MWAFVRVWFFCCVVFVVCRFFCLGVLVCSGWVRLHGCVCLFVAICVYLSCRYTFWNLCANCRGRSFPVGCFGFYICPAATFTARTCAVRAVCVVCRFFFCFYAFRRHPQLQKTVAICCTLSDRWFGGPSCCKPLLPINTLWSIEYTNIYIRVEHVQHGTSFATSWFEA